MIVRVPGNIAPLLPPSFEMLDVQTRVTGAKSYRYEVSAEVGSRLVAALVVLSETHPEFRVRREAVLVAGRVQRQVRMSKESIRKS